MTDRLGIGHLFELKGGGGGGVLHPARGLRRVPPRAAHPPGTTGARLRRGPGERLATELPPERDPGIRPRAHRVGIRADGDAARPVLPLLGLCRGRRYGRCHGPLDPRGVRAAAGPVGASAPRAPPSDTRPRTRQYARRNTAELVRLPGRGVTSPPSRVLKKGGESPLDPRFRRGSRIAGRRPAGQVTRRGRAAAGEGPCSPMRRPLPHRWWRLWHFPQEIAGEGANRRRRMTSPDPP